MPVGPHQVLAARKARYRTAVHTLPLVVSSTSIRSLRPAFSRSRLYRATWCVFPSVMFTSMLKLDGEYHVEAIRSAVAYFWSARTPAVEADQVYVPVLFTVTCAYAG